MSTTTAGNMRTREIAALADLYDAEALRSIDLEGDALERAAAASAGVLRAATRGMAITDRLRLDVEINRRVIDTMQENMEALLKKVRALEGDGESMGALVDKRDGAPVLRWRGIWTDDIQYRAGEVVAHADALFVCESLGIKGVKPGKGAETGWRRILKTPDLRGASHERTGRNGR